jgi:hypothetical protein
MSTMAISPQRPATADQLVFSYYAREALGIDNTGSPYAGLELGPFRAARARLVVSGSLVRTPNGRYVPAELAKDST